MNKAKKQNYSKKQGNSKNNQKKQWSKNDKYVVKEAGFEDLELLLNLLRSSSQYANILIRTAFGSMTFDSLTESDIGKHVAVFVDYNTIPEWFFNKKFDKGNDKNSIINFDIAFEQSQKDYAHLIPRGAFITAEIMNQNRPYAKSDKKMSICLHGSIVASVPPEIVTFRGLEQLCDAYKMEGFVCVSTETSARFKLKQCCFPKGDLGKGQHEAAPQIDDFTEVGLNLCNGGKDGYHVAALANVTEKQIIAEKFVNGIKTQLIVLPNETAIRNQIEFPFDGDKMMNFYETDGEGKTYRYIDKLNFIESPENLLFQKKFDGESILLHVDNNDQFHMLIRFNVDAFKVEYENGETEVRFGWIKK